ncbi:MAG: protein kinase [Candidatus Aminicenantes bacterium]|nr:protein kinase [Candidatus Aminicenantes bacterium]
MKCLKCHSNNPSDTLFCGKCGTKFDPAAQVSSTRTLDTTPHELVRGEIFAGRFELIEELGAGGMGRVYRAYDKEVGEEIALKILHPEIALDERTVERFRNEIKLARRITHRNVCRMHELHQDGQQLFITMEYVAGEDLKSFIRRAAPLNSGKAVFIAQQVAEGLAEAHKLGVIHRDLKPQNIMIDKEGNARIMDFGIARLVGAKGMTGGNVMIGTPGYMSPEQVEGKEADPGTDLYALGIVLFEMLTGCLPFEGETPLSIAVKQKSEAPPDPRALNTQIPEDLDRIILKCLEKSREKRYRIAAELLADLAKVEKSLPTTPHALPTRKPSTSKEITVRLPSKKIWIPGAIVLLALVGFLIRQIIPEKAGAGRSIAVIGFKNQTGDAELDYLREAIPHLLITSLEQSHRIRVTSWERMKDLLRNSGRDAAAIFDEEAGFEVCRKEGIEAVVLGSFVKAGETFATDVQVLDASSKHILKSASARGDGVASILKSQIDEISRTIRRGIAPPALKIEAPGRKIIDLTTSSMEAYGNYLKAREANENFFWADARKFAEKAVTVDPTFAVAYYVLARAAGNLLDDPARDKALEKAKIYSARATEKDRLFIEAEYAGSIERDPAKEIRLLKDLVDKYPEDKEAHYELGVLFYKSDRNPEAIGELEKAIAIDLRYGPAVNELGYAYADAGDFAKAAQSFERYAELKPGLPNPVDSIAEMNLFMGKLDEAAAKYQEALAIKPDFFNAYPGLAYVYALKEDYGAVGRWVEEYPKKAPAQWANLDGPWLKGVYDYLLGRLDSSLTSFLFNRSQAEKFKYPSGVAYIDWIMGFLYTDRGEFGKSLAAFRSSMDSNIKDDPSRRAYYAADYSFCLGWVELKQGRLEAVKTHLTEMENVLPGLDPTDRAELTLDYSLLSAEAALAGNSVGKAISLGEKIVFGMLPSVNSGSMGRYNIPFLKDVLARAYWKNGDLNKAIAEYERLTTIDPKNRLRMLIHPLYHYRFGRVLEEKGVKKRACLEYEKFLKYWADADPRFVESKDARNRLARLKVG